ncbi:stalk domain-containing protein [Paenibacillus sp. sgz500958]|uniref:stalk domain-containing protein n=1 Tax=Paenibacillus sp. sgz500958 TaxID=3242475 RepID=UPI0036D2ED44
MKKFIIGLICGVVITCSSAAFASGSIQAVLFPAVFQINEHTVPLSKDYKVVSLDGHAYVPVRFVAEHLGAVIGYDPELQSIQIKNGALNLTDPDYTGISVGNLVLTKSGSGTNVTGQLRLEGVGNTQNKITATVSFYNDNSQKIGSVTINGNAFGVDAKTFNSYGTGDFRAYSAVNLHIDAVNNKPILKALPIVYENAKYKFTLELPRSWEGKYEVTEQSNPDRGTESYSFINTSNKAEYGGYLFGITVMDIKKWNEMAQTAMEVAPIWKVGEKGGKAFILIPAGDVQYNPNDSQLTEDYMSMSKYINSIRTTFKVK